MEAWISIQDRKPEAGQKVLVSANGVVTAAIAVMELYGNAGIWWDGCGFSGCEWEFDFKNEEVTHWMPLPVAP